MNRKRGLLLLAVLIGSGSLGLIIYGQKLIGPVGLSLMLVGLAGLLSLLYAYNKSFTSEE
ncbi:hypothetical protein I6N95_06495 [Vagococcus sp. BWB3-3]|uniref:Uncharacterized protein n=1 Tax=Vagococcus allomyrinae TaxID=2794353 RepID=A0A940SV22_9ENTE|nr:hypothetical protein [Vagococcus allomyrinae]MBP1040646.1 hypothetical protein [Vagococcus allomyrinae]